MNKAFVFALLSALALGGCASGPKDQTVTLVAADDLNPDSTGRPSPAVVRVYQLSDDRRMSQADFFQLMDKEKSVLGEDLIAEREVTVRPGEVTVVSFPPSDRPIHSVTVVAGYRLIDKATWRVTITDPKDAETVKVGSLAIAPLPTAR